MAFLIVLTCGLTQELVCFYANVNKKSVVIMFNLCVYIIYYIYMLLIIYDLVPGKF